MKKVTKALYGKVAILYQRLKKDLPNFPYLGGEYEFERPKVPPQRSSEAFATQANTRVGGA